jgi:hypothetical protein
MLSVTALTTAITLVSISATLLAARREEVELSYNAITAEKRREYLEGKTKNEYYIYPNQKYDAIQIVEGFYERNRRIITVLKKTKVGANGLMVEIAKCMTTHKDDQFVVNPANVRILTGMSNTLWEEEIKGDSPSCFKDKIFHHGQLKKAELKNMRDSLIIIDEIDAGTGEWSVLHTLLYEAGVLDVEHMKKHNNRFVVISASPIKQLYETKCWGDLHEYYKMTIPKDYIGHYDFLERKIIQEFYPLTNLENVKKWINEDILTNYDNDFRVHIVRVTNKSEPIIKKICIQHGIKFKNHNSTERLTEEDEKELYIEPLTRHVVVAVKGLLRRANLIKNEYKLRIGATHELYTKKPDFNVQNQGLPGRMTGYWRSIIEGGHKTGPYRTSCEAIRQCENNYQDPFGDSNYHTNGFTKKKGKVTSHTDTMLAAKNIKNLKAVEMPGSVNKGVDINLYRIYNNEEIVKAVCKLLNYKYNPTNNNTDGFKETSLNKKLAVASLQDAIEKVPTAYGTNNGKTTYRTYYPCYVDTSDNKTLHFVVIIRPETDSTKIKDCDEKYPYIPLSSFKALSENTHTEVVDSSGISLNNSSNGKEECKNILYYSDVESVIADSLTHDKSENNYSSEPCQPAISAKPAMKRKPKVAQSSQ